MDYKIVFMSSYEEANILNDNLDVKIILSSNLVYSGTLYTTSNNRSLN
jgi:hypothetical protein